MSGKEFDRRFMYEVCFGFMPRRFHDTPHDRYIYEEEGDVTELYFISKGEWCVAFDSHTNDDLNDIGEENDLKGTQDM
jgi:hypothetical protein